MPFIHRQRDILARAPTLDEYLQFRWIIQTQVVELFHFSLSHELATELETILRRGASGQFPHEYNPSTPGLFCSHAISDFLQKFGAQRFQIEKKMLFPHEFAKALYDNAPDWVILFRPSGGEVVVGDCFGS